MEISERHGLSVIEDAAHATTGSHSGRSLGTIGQLGTLSFHETKNCNSGEGGALLINDPALIERAEIVREKGTNRSRFLRGEVDRYTWVDSGSSYLPSEVVAAFLYAQLEAVDRIDARRLELWERYREGLHELEERGVLRLPIVPAHCQHNAHMFYIILEIAEARTGLIEHLARDSIHAVHHYVPLHSSPQGLRVGRVASTMRVFRARGS